MGLGFDDQTGGLILGGREELDGALEMSTQWDPLLLPEKTFWGQHQRNGPRGSRADYWEARISALSWM